MNSLTLTILLILTALFIIYIISAWIIILKDPNAEKETREFINKAKKKFKRGG